MGKKIVTGEVRLSYAHLLEPKAISEGGELKYSVSILIPKKNKKQVATIEKVINELIDSEQATLKGRKNLKTPLRDGDDSDKEGYEGHWFISVSNKYKPIVIDEDRNEIIDAREIYSGCYGKVSMNLFAFNTAGNKGIGASLNSVMKTRDGESLGGAVYNEAEAYKDFGFDDDEDEDDDALS